MNRYIDEATEFDCVHMPWIEESTTNFEHKLGTYFETRVTCQRLCIQLLFWDDGMKRSSHEKLDVVSDVLKFEGMYLDYVQ